MQALQTIIEDEPDRAERRFEPINARPALEAVSRHAASPARPFLRRVLELIRHVIEEDPNPIRGRRIFPVEDRDLEQTLSTVPQELVGPSTIDFRVIVEGLARSVCHAVRNDIYQIVREALLNAFRHSEASRIELHLQYTPPGLRIAVCDNGKGISAKLVRAGCDGLCWMRERVDRMGGKLNILSRAGAGTEIQVWVPGLIAFERHSSDDRTGWLSRWYSRQTNSQETQNGSE